MTTESNNEPKEYPVVCPDCNVQMRLRGRAKLLYQCPKCKGTLSAGAKGKPKGVPATKAVRLLRQRAHAAFDRFWKTGNVTRSEAQKWLAQELGIKPKRCHFGYMNEDTLRRVMQVCDSARMGIRAGPTPENLDPATKECRRMANEALSVLLSAGGKRGAVDGWIRHYAGTNGKSVGEFSSEECRRLIGACRAAMRGQVRLPRGVQEFSETTRKKNVEKFGKYLQQIHAQMMGREAA